MGVVLALLLAAAPPTIDLGGLPANVRQPIRNF
jgi:hypothetical protein